MIMIEYRIDLRTIIMGLTYDIQFTDVINHNLTTYVESGMLANLMLRLVQVVVTQSAVFRIKYRILICWHIKQIKK
jgi:hypothetical protein